MPKISASKIASEAAIETARCGALHAWLPEWLPAEARLYLDHTVAGLSLRALARREGCHASTVLRRVQRFENRRDDPLVDEALTRLGLGRSAAAGAARGDPVAAGPAGPTGRSPPAAPARPVALPVTRPNTPTETRPEESPAMSAPRHPVVRSETRDRAEADCDAETIAQEGRRILRRLCEPGTTLVIAPDLPRAVVLKSGPDGEATRLAVVDRAVAQAFALKDWIACRAAGRVTQYAITAAGRAALRRMIGARGKAAVPCGAGFDEAATPYADQHRDFGARTGTGPAEEGARLRVNLCESPVAALARRRDRDGKPFLTPELVAAAERLREDFELAQMGPRVAQNWDRFLTGGGDRGAAGPGRGPAEGPRSARERVAAALRDLGPGLGDMALRCCCYLEGLEAAERRLGWSARSGKIVLRIALVRLRRHYDAQPGGAPLIG